jgi:apolipoprotein N-acyltransferase
MMSRLHLFLLSLLSGLLFAFAWPERGFSPLIFVAFVPLFFIQQNLGDQNRKGMFWYAWLAFLIWNVLTTWWIWYSTDVGSILAMMLNSLFVAVVFYVFHLSKKKLYSNRKGFIILLFYWITWEFFHMNWDLTWSWLNLGNVFASNPAWIQWYDITGTMGGTAWVILVNILFYHVIRYLLAKDFGRDMIVNTLALLLLLIIPVSYSYVVYSNYEEVEDPVEIVVVQPNTDPYTEAYDIPARELLEKNLNMARPFITDSTLFVVYPESTLYDGVRSIWEDALNRSPLISRVQEFAGEYPHVSVVIGASTHRLIGKDEPRNHAARKFTSSEGYYYAYNTAFLIDTSDYIQIHHKSKLTPGVEIMPSWGILKPIESLAINLGGMTGTLAKDETPVVFNSVTNTSISPIICYESIYGEFVAKTVLEGAAFIFIITNDGWWGRTPGHRQHARYAVLRAIETRRSIARSANTGISSFINQRGDVVKSTEYWEPDVIRMRLNRNNELTYYVRNGDYLARAASFISALILLISFTQGFLRKKKSLSR